MERIEIPREVIQRASQGPYLGRALEFIVKVDWPELRLTEPQVLANAAWMAAGGHGTRPFPDRSIFAVVVPYAPESR